MKIVVLAGGSGQRLWPLSRKSYPKQFLHFGDGVSLLQKTIARFSGHDVFIVTGFDYAHMIQHQVEGVEVIVEPERKNTGPAMVFAIGELMRKGKLDEDDVVLFTPSDQFLAPESVFRKGVALGERAAREERLVTFGITPLKAETGFGYIKGKGEGSVLEVEAFVEKPVRAVAERYLAERNYYWNAGMFLFRVGTFLSEVSTHAPELLREFAACPSISIDKALFEKSKRVTLVPLDVMWSDVGSWDSVYDVLQKDGDGSVKVGNVHAFDTKNSLIFADKRLVATAGVEDLLVIETEDALFVGKRGESQAVKQVVEELSAKGMSESHEHLTIHRPWGTYSILEEREGFKIKRIVVNVGGCLSLQKHKRRSEHWVVVKGAAKVTLGEQEMTLMANQSVFVPKGVMHRLENRGEEVLEIIEVQVGGYLGEDDIERFDDVYGRAGLSLLS